MEGERRIQELVARSAENSPPGRPRHRWEDNIKMDLKSGVKAWTGTDRGVTCVNAVMKLRFA